MGASTARTRLKHFKSTPHIFISRYSELFRFFTETALTLA